ncbi:MAG: tetratricopeptide repeat protein [Nitrospinae bacterium]|nr:tetratricopeptide repeat protein [Nitrospinota bacterium]
MAEPATSKKSFFYVGIILLVLISFSYANTLNSPLNFDDHAVLQQINLAGPDYYNNFSPIQYRHLFFLSFIINQSQNGLPPVGYHMVNISFHFITALILFFLVFLTLENGTNWKRQDALGIAGLTAILFAINPLNTETVTYISGRASGMAGCFYLLALLAFVLGSLNKFSGKILIFYSAALLSFVAAILSKETSLTFPAIVILYDFCFMNNDRWVSLKKRLAFLYLPILSSLLALLIFQPSFQQMVTKWIGKMDFNYAIAQAQILGFAFKLCFFPINLIFDYDFTPNWFASGPFKWLPVLLWFSLAGVILKNFKKLPVIIPFSILWYILTISITNSFLPRADLLSERNLYLPGIGPTLLISCAYHQFFFIGKRWPLKPGLAFLALLLVIQGSLVIKRNSSYKSNITLWEDTLKKSPFDLKVLHNLSHFYLENKAHDKALVTLVKLSRSNASAFYKSFAHSNLGSIHAQNKNFKLAENEFNKAIQLDATIPLGYLNLGTYYASRGWYQKAKTTLEMARDRYKKYRWGYAMPTSLNFNLARVNFELKNFSESEKYLKQFLSDVDEPANGLLLLGKVYQQMGEVDPAIETYRKIKGPSEIQAKAANNLGILYLSMDQPEMALTEFERSLKLNPRLPDSHYNLGKLILDSNGNIESARAHLNAAFSLTKNSALKTQIKNLLSRISP